MAGHGHRGYPIPTSASRATAQGCSLRYMSGSHHHSGRVWPSDKHCSFFPGESPQGRGGAKAESCHYPSSLSGKDESLMKSRHIPPAIMNVRNVGRHLSFSGRDSVIVNIPTVGAKGQAYQGAVRALRCLVLEMPIAPGTAVSVAGAGVLLGSFAGGAPVLSMPRPKRPIIAVVSHGFRRPYHVRLLPVAAPRRCG